MLEARDDDVGPPVAVEVARGDVARQLAAAFGVDRHALEAERGGGPPSFVQVATASPTAPTSTCSSAVRAPARSGHTTAAALTAATTIYARTAHRAAALLSPESG